MKRNPSTPPYLSWCLIVRDSEKRLPGGLEACLKSLRERTPDAEIVIVDTMSSDAATLEVSKRYADVWSQYTGPEGTWTVEMAAFDDAAAARQRSFELASGYWRGWIDDDDRLVGPEEAKRLLELNGRWKPAGKAVVGDAPGNDVPMGLEEILAFIDKNDADVHCICAPYFYRRSSRPGEEDIAESWQERERIVKWSTGWKWVEPGHEVLVPVDDSKKHGVVNLEHMLFVHEKKWTAEDVDYSISRHFKIMKDRYAAGDRSMRTIRYLCIYAPAVDAGHWEEYVAAYLANANTLVDHYRARIAAGDFASFRDAHLEALGHYAAATSLVPGLVDAWICGARAAAACEDWDRAISQYREALKLTPNFADSIVTPREFMFAVPLRAAQALQKRADVLVLQGRGELAEAFFKEAYSLADRVASSASIGMDEMEASAFAAQARNKWEGQRAAGMIAFLFDYLRRNDETVKTLSLLQAAPHTIEDHPVLVELEAKTRPLRKHLDDPGAYAYFYDNLSTTTDAIPTHTFTGQWLDPATSLPRVKMLIAWLKAHPQATEVVEVGSYDGIVSIPVLRACPWVRYTAIDANHTALSRMRDYAKEFVPDGCARLKTIQATTVPESVVKGDHYDVAVFFEVIEHVPDPVKTIVDIKRLLKADGHLFVSTPWGAFDCGTPDESKKPRDMRGHVRAYTLFDFVADVRTAGMDPIDVYNQKLPFGIGNTLQAISVPWRKKKAVNFFVPSALWDWNSRLVHTTGMGASEKTIVDLAAHLTEGNYRAHVFGPVNEEEVHRGVAYFTRAKIRMADPEVPIVVSRGPAAGDVIDELVGVPTRKLLWLQDAMYPDLNAKVAEGFEKVVVLTEWHEDVIHERCGVPREKFVRINNFLNEGLYRHGGPAREPFHFIYSSSPDRGLTTLLELWPRILERWPQATLDIFYGWEGAKKLAILNPQWTEIYRRMRAEFDKLSQQPGVKVVGRVDPQRLAYEMMRASVWAYPTHFGETGCSTSIEVQAAGCVPVCTPFAGLAETAESPWTKFVPIHRTEEGWVGGKPKTFEEADARKESYFARFLERVAEALEVSPSERVKMADRALATHGLTQVAPRWEKLIWG